MVQLDDDISLRPEILAMSLFFKGFLHIIYIACFVMHMIVYVSNVASARNLQFIVCLWRFIKKKPSIIIIFSFLYFYCYYTVPIRNVTIENSRGKPAASGSRYPA